MMPGSRQRGKPAAHAAVLQKGKRAKLPRAGRCRGHPRRISHTKGSWVKQPASSQPHFWLFSSEALAATQNSWPVMLLGAVVPWGMAMPQLA